MLDLSDEQNTAAMHGLGDTVPTWSLIERPVGRFETPAWCGGAHIDWMQKFANSPSFKFKQVDDMPAFGVWKREGRRWWRETADGSIVDQYWHGGDLKLNETDGAWHSTKDRGYGGRAFILDAVEGIGKVVLHGPWFGNTPAGYSELITVDMRKPYNHRFGRKWHDKGGTFGYYISDETLIKLTARYQPHVELCLTEIYANSGQRVQPINPAWGVPKHIWLEQKRQEWEANRTIKRD